MGLRAGESVLAECNRLVVDYPQSLAREFPTQFPLAWDAVGASLEATKGADLEALAIHSPALRGFDWTAYLRCSAARMVRALAAVQRAVPQGGHVLDAGAYFGNFSLMLDAAGYQVDAADAFETYGSALKGVTDTLRQRGIRVVDTSGSTGLSRLAESGAHYDAVLAMGVIEHVPHTPRLFLECVDTLLKPAGLLVMDTPNLAYLYNRQRLQRGESIFCPIALQYHSALPFEGHHREYTVAEVRWMVETLGHVDIDVNTFNYSFYNLAELVGTDLENHQAMADDPALREVIIVTSRKRPAASP